MDLDTIVRCGLVLEALACLWLGRRAWAQAAREEAWVRLGAPVVACAAAAVILYGAFHL